MRAKKFSINGSQRRSWFLVLGAGAITAAVVVANPGLGLPSTTSSSITNSPKEVIDQVWQIVYRDFLDSSGGYDPRSVVHSSQGFALQVLCRNS